jgi:K+-sensing histidine kinase KdpD
LKLYESEESVRRACQIAKAQTLDVMVVGGLDVTHEAINNTEQSEAYQQLVDMAEKLRAESPFLSTDQAFARVFENPKHAAIASKAHRRPAPTTSYEFPR